MALALPFFSAELSYAGGLTQMLTDPQLTAALTAVLNQLAVPQLTAAQKEAKALAAVSNCQLWLANIDGYIEIYPSAVSVACQGALTSIDCKTLAQDVVEKGASATPMEAQLLASPPGGLSAMNVWSYFNFGALCPP